MNEIDPKALILLKANRSKLKWQQYKTMRGQVLAGDAKGALKGLNRLIRRQEEEDTSGSI